MYYITSFWSYIIDFVTYTSKWNYTSFYKKLLKKDFFRKKKTFSVETSFLMEYQGVIDILKVSCTILGVLIICQIVLCTIWVGRYVWEENAILYTYMSQYCTLIPPLARKSFVYIQMESIYATERPNWKEHNRKS